MKGKLIVIEGACDGVGKTTQFNLLKEYLENNGYKVYTHHFPTYHSKQGKTTEYYLNGDFGSPEELSPYLVNSFYALDRAITWKQELKGKYEQGYVILLDRYTTSSLIYQSSLIEDEKEKLKFMNFVEDYEYMKLNIKKPDMVIFLTADYDVILNMRKNRVDNDGVLNDVYERDEKLMKKIYDNSSFVAKNSGFSVVKCDKNGKMKSIDDIQSEIRSLIKNI